MDAKVWNGTLNGKGGIIMANLIIPTKKNMNVTQSWVWTIAVAKGNFSLYEMRILARLVEIAQSEIDNKKPISQQLYELYLCPDISGNVDRYIVLPISSILDDNNGNNYARVKKAFVDLAGKVFSWDYKNETRIDQMIYKVRIQKGTGKVSFYVSEWVWTAILDLTKGYRRYEILSFLRLRSTYSMILYTIISGQKKPLYYTVDGLRDLLGLNDKYSRPASIVERILEPVKKELDATTPYSFDYKVKRGGKKEDGLTSPIIGFTFIPILHDENKDPNIFRREKYAKLTARAGLESSLVYDFLHNEMDFDSKQIKANMETIKRGLRVIGESEFIDFIKEVAENGCPNANNPKGYLIGAIKQKIKDIESTK